MERTPIKAALVSANALLREGLTRILGTADFDVVASGAVVDDNLLGSLPRGLDVLLIIDASNDFDAAVSQIVPFKLRCPEGRVAMLVGRHQLQLPQMISAFRRGAGAYLTNFTTPEAFIKSLELVMLGETVLPTAMLTYLLSHQHDRSDRRQGGGQDGPNANEDCNEVDREEGNYDEEEEDFGAIRPASPHLEGNYSPHLSARHMSILRCLIEGDSNKAIARKMKIADATVKVHVKAILRKIRVENRTQAAIWAMRNGPLISANRENLYDETGPPVQRAPNVKVSEPPSLRVLSSGRKNEPVSSPVLETEGANHVAASSFDRSDWKGLLRRNT